MFILTPRQEEANRILGSQSKYIFLYGGSRSGKTALIIRALCIRAMKAPGSRHAVFRFRSNAIKPSIVLDTFPSIMASCFPDVEYTVNMADMYATFPNGSQIWFSGLDDAQRVEKVLGNEYASLFFNESSQIPHASYLMALTRLAQKVDQDLGDGKKTPLSLRVFVDANPPNKANWLYRLFILKSNPETKVQLARPEDYVSFQMNPADNVKNLPADYIDTLNSMPERMKRRFLYGEFSDSNPNALFSELSIDRWRRTDGALPDMVRLVVGVDPSGADDDENKNNDEIGIMVVGLGTDGVAYVMEDLTVKVGPATWGRIATDAYARHRADVIVGEGNFGGSMVRHVIKTADSKANFKLVTASRGKVQRAEPFSPLFDDGRIRVSGFMPELEDELVGFSTHGYTGPRSPNRADALFWCLAEIFSSLVAAPRKEKRPVLRFSRGGTAGRSNSWMTR